MKPLPKKSAHNKRDHHSMYNKDFPDCTISKRGIEYDMSEILVKALYLNERLPEFKDKHENLNEYDNELNKDANYHPNLKVNEPLKHARDQKVQRHRDLLPQLLF